MSQIKLQPEELKELQDLKQEIIGLASTLGELEYQAILIEIDRDNLKNQVKSVKERERAALKSFGEKYGDGIINLDTGEIEPRTK